MQPFHNQRLLAMYRLMSDAANLMRLRLRPAEEYTYPLPDCLGALVMVAAVNTAMFSPVLNGQYGMIAFVLCLNLVKWPVFAGVMTRLMGALGGRWQSLWGYTLLTEVLSLPALLILYVPSLALLLQVWMAWTFAVGVMGYARLCGVRPWRLWCCLLRPALSIKRSWSRICSAGSSRWLHRSSKNKRQLEYRKRLPEISGSLFSI
ncbi:hypothetical protein [Eikenella corrodens]|uniref:Uncharacterized protein n=1 Tax=Eikenella corrodens TaxID=539 RepID=A0A3S9SHY0_EIKCO|nr:hypothetical protein [Eikenella corrodens]AZR59048.1 hypothetical protein ELB75_02755 [Eikenella corrodens]